MLRSHDPSRGGVIRRVGHPERGSGPVGSLAGVAVFAVLVLFATQLSLDLYGRSTVTAAGYDAARAAARPSATGGAVPDLRALTEAEQHLRRALGRLGRHLEVDWTGTDADEVRLRIRVSIPSVTPGPRLDGVVGLGAVDRRFNVRVERFRA